MNIEEVYKLMGKFEGSLLAEMELEMEGVKISLKKGLPHAACREYILLLPEKRFLPGR